MTLKVQTKSGDAILASAFLAIKDGLAVTAWHAVRDASTVSAKFSDGEEFDVSGVVDHDEKRDVAIIKVKVADRPLLAFSAQVPEVGAKCFVIGAPNGLEFSLSDGIISQLRDFEGTRELQFTCPVGHGNSGSPLLDDKGQVLGIVDWQVRDSQNLNFAISGTYAKGLDATLPTKAWDTLAASPVAVKPTDRALDAALANGVVLFEDCGTVLEYLKLQVVTKKNGYRLSMDPGVYVLQDRAVAVLKELAASVGTNKLLESARKELAAKLYERANALDLAARAIRSAQQNRGWTPSAKDLYAHSVAARMLGNASLPATAAFYSIRSNQFGLPRHSQIYLGVARDPSGFRLGVGTLVRDDLRLIYVTAKSFGDRLGLRGGDRIDSVNGASLSDLYDFKARVRDSLGSMLNIEITRLGKHKELKFLLPKEFPAASLRQ